MFGLLKFLSPIWLVIGVGLFIGFLKSLFDTSFGEALSRLAWLIGIWLGVGAVGLVIMFVLGNIGYRKEKSRLLGLIERRDYSGGGDLQIAAPEAYMLLNEFEVNPTEVLKAGILQAVATGQLYVNNESEPVFGQRESPAATSELQPQYVGVPVVGSIAVLVKEEGVRSSVKECVERFKTKYKNPEGFIDQEVMPRLLQMGYLTKGVGLTESGLHAKSILEGRVGAALYEMKQNGGPSIDDDPWNALLAALAMVSTGLPMHAAAE